jgi:hypothetical protein
LDRLRPDIVDALLGKVAMTREVAEQHEAQHAATAVMQGPAARAIESSLNAMPQLLHAGIRCENAGSSGYFSAERPGILSSHDDLTAKLPGCLE